MTDPRSVPTETTETLRCLITGNPIGTDTRPVDSPCTCANCASRSPTADPEKDFEKLLDEIESCAKVLGRVEFLWERDENVPTYQMEEAQKDFSAARQSLVDYVERLEEALSIADALIGNTSGQQADHWIDKAEEYIALRRISSANRKEVEK